MKRMLWKFAINTTLGLVRTALPALRERALRTKSRNDERLVNAIEVVLDAADAGDLIEILLNVKR